jgi:hypothetical protein
MLFERVDHDDRTRLSAPALAALGRQTAPEAMLERVRTRVTALSERVGYPASDELLDRAQAVIGERAGRPDLRLTHMDLRPENLCFHGDAWSPCSTCRTAPSAIRRPNSAGWPRTAP